MRSRAFMMRKRGFLRTFAALLALGLPSQGCSTSEDAPDSYTYDELRTLLASSYCDALRDCCAASNTTFNEADCMHQVRPEWLVHGSEERERTGTIIYRRDAADTCAAAIRARMAQCTGEALSLEDFLSDARMLDTTCADVVDGIVGPGEECERDPSMFRTTRCAHAGPGTRSACGWTKPSIDDPSRNRYVGKCYQMTISKVGEPCDAIATLVDGQYQGYRRCESYGNHCAFPDDTSTIGICQPSKSIGESCSPNDREGDCDARGYCNEETAVCTPFPGEGEPCGNGKPHCAIGLECEKVKGCGWEECHDTCVKPKAVMFSTSSSACQAGPYPRWPG